MDSLENLLVHHRDRLNTLEAYVATLEQRVINTNAALVGYDDGIKEASDNRVFRSDAFLSDANRILTRSIEAIEKANQLLMQIENGLIAEVASPTIPVAETDSDYYGLRGTSDNKISATKLSRR